MSVTINYKNDTLATFRRATKTLTTKGKFLEDDISITDDTTNGSVYQDDDGYVVINDEAGSGLSLLPLNVTENGTYRTNNEDTGYSPVTVNVHTDPTLQSKSVNPTESSQTVKPDTNYDGLSQVTVGAISNTYVGSSVPRMAATNLTVSGSTVTTPSGYYASAVSKNVAGGTATTPGTSVTTNPTITLSNTTGVITASYNATKSITPTVTAGYINAGTAGTVRYSGTATYSLSTQATKTVTPTETAQTVVSSGYFTTGDVKVAGISSNYVGTNVTRISAADMTHSGGTVTAPSGYYASALTHAVGNGTATTPATTLTFAPAISVDAATGKITATISGSSNITPTVTAGYVNAGTAGKITVSGSNTLTMSTKAAATITPTETAQTVVSSGYYTLGDVKVAGISSTYVGTGVATRSVADLTVSASKVTVPTGYFPTAVTATVTAGALEAGVTFSNSPTISVTSAGIITAINSTSFSFSPVATAGYIPSGRSMRATISGSSSYTLSTRAGATITPTTATQLAVSSGYFTTGSVYVGPMPQGALSNITIGNGHIGEMVIGTSTLGDLSPVMHIDSTTGVVTALVSSTISGIKPVATNGYLSSGAMQNITVVAENGIQLDIQPAKRIIPSMAQQIAISSGYYATGSVIVEAIPTNYVIPNGDYTISSNGYYDIPTYYGVNVNVPIGGGSEDNSILNSILDRTINGTYENSTLNTVGTYAFASCTTLSSVNFQNCTKISSSAFLYCYNLSTVNFPSVTIIGSYAFNSCSKLASISFPLTTSIGSYAFWGCINLSIINFPNVLHINGYAFRSCTKLISVNFPETKDIGSYAFGNCSSLPSINFPKVSTIGSYAFRNCSKLTLVSLPAITSIYTLAFTSCYALQSVYLFNSVVASGQANIFQSTPIALSSYLGYFGSIYVRQSLLESWKTAANWSVYSDHFVGLTDTEIAALR